MVVLKLFMRVIHSAVATEPMSFVVEPTKRLEVPMTLLTPVLHQPNVDKSAKPVKFEIDQQDGARKSAA